MFESDDFDQVLSQFDFPEIPNAKESSNVVNKECTADNNHTISSTFVHPVSPASSHNLVSNNTQNNEIRTEGFVSPKHSKRKMINSLFDTNNKRKFPGPAGLLTGSLEENKDDICHMELLSQDIDFSQNNMRKDIFESPLWDRLMIDIREWDVESVNSIKTIKQQALTGNLHKRKAQTITAFVEAVDRSAIDPLIILRDKSGSIKCTLHRDAWLMFSPYIASEYCAFILKKPTVLTTGGAFKKHYLNITLSNIFAIYSTAVLKDCADSKPFAEDFTKAYERDFTVIKKKTEITCDSAINTTDRNGSIDVNNDDLLGDLDGSIFLDDIF